MAGSSIPHLILGDGKLPLDWHEGDLPPVISRDFGFNFVFLGVPVAALFHEDDDNAWLSLSGEVGALPFSAESPQARVNVQGILDAANAKMKSEGHAVRMILDRGRIALDGRIAVGRPSTVVTVVAAVVYALAPLRPYLDAVRIFLTPADQPGGGRLRPEFRRRARK